MKCQRRIDTRQCRKETGTPERYCARCQQYYRNKHIYKWRKELTQLHGVEVCINLNWN